MPSPQAQAAAPAEVLRRRAQLQAVRPQEALLQAAPQELQVPLRAQVRSERACSTPVVAAAGARSPRRASEPAQRGSRH
jgi:hypothetical protein